MFKVDIELISREGIFIVKSFKNFYDLEQILNFDSFYRDSSYYRRIIDVIKDHLSNFYTNFRLFGKRCTIFEDDNDNSIWVAGIKINDKENYFSVEIINVPAILRIGNYIVKRIFSLDVSNEPFSIEFFGETETITFSVDIGKIMKLNLKSALGYIIEEGVKKYDRLVRKRGNFKLFHINGWRICYHKNLFLTRMDKNKFSDEEYTEIELIEFVGDNNEHNGVLIKISIYQNPDDVPTVGLTKKAKEKFEVHINETERKILIKKKKFSFLDILRFL